MITIRQAEKKDLEKLSELFDLYRIYYHQPSDIAAAKKFLKERFENNESVVFLAEKENTLVGFTQLYPIFSSVGLKRSWLLNDLYVQAMARRQGVAAQLLEAAKNHGLRTDARWLLLQTTADNYSAQTLYEKNGWQKLSDYFYELPLSS